MPRKNREEIRPCQSGVGEEIRIFGQNIYPCWANLLIISCQLLGNLRISGKSLVYCDSENVHFLAFLSQKYLFLKKIRNRHYFYRKRPRKLKFHQNVVLLGCQKRYDSEFWFFGYFGFFGQINVKKWENLAFFGILA